MNIIEDEIIKPIDMAEFEKVFTPDIKSVITAVRKYGFDIRVVGGAVRDFILGKAPRDVDFATDADPAELMLIFDLEDIDYDAGGIEHGTIKAVFGEEKIDVTSIGFKIEVIDSKMQIQRGDGWEEDAQGRDLTINSMSLDMDGKIHDYLDGIRDLKSSVIRLNPSQYEKIDRHPDIIMRWYKAFGYFDSPVWPRKDYEMIKSKLPLLAKIKHDSKTAKTLGSIIATRDGREIIDLMCKMGAGKYIDIDCI
jgi:tRNA nucleotidyltransferase (CCA-adding enzyme)